MTTKTSQDHTSLQMRIAAMIMGSTMVPHPQLDNARRIAGVILKLIEEDETVATIQSEDALAPVRNMKDGCDGPDSIPPTTDAIRAAEVLLTTKPFVMPLNDGGLLLEYDSSDQPGRIFLQLEFGPNGTLDANSGVEETIQAKDDHDCTESEAYGELYRSVLALKIGSNLPADDVEAMTEAHRRWVPIGEPNCNSFREAFNAGFKAALTTGRDRTRPQSCCHVVGAGNVCLRPQDHEGPHVGWDGVQRERE